MKETLTLEDHLKNPSPLADSSVNEVTTFPSLTDSNTQANIDFLVDSFCGLNLGTHPWHTLNCNGMMYWLTTLHK